MDPAPETELDTLRRRIIQLDVVLRANNAADGSRRGSIAEIFQGLNVLDGLMEPAAVIDRDWRLAYLNHHALASAHLSGDKTPGSSCWDFLGLDKESSEAEHLRRALCDRVHVQFEYPHAHRMNEVDAYPIADGLLIFIREKRFTVLVPSDKRADDALRRSERQLRSVLDKAPAYISYIDTDLRYVHVNRAYEKLMGRPKSEIEGRAISELFGAEMYDRVRERIERALAGETVTFDWINTLDSRGERHMSVIYSPDKDEQGVVHGFIAMSQDITERKQNELALRAREQESRSLLAALPDIISRFDRDLRIVYSSPAVERMTGQPPEFFTGKTHIEAGVPPELAERLDACLRRVFESGNQETLECDFHSPLLGLRHLLGTATPETNSDGKISSVLTILRDITEKRNAQEELAVLLAREQKARETAEMLNKIGPMLAAELDLERLAQSVTDVATRLAGAEFGAFVRNDVNEKNEVNVPYTVSGAAHRALSRVAVPEGILRCNDVTTDPRYDKEACPFGLPDANLTVRSYLAVPVVSRSGEVLGGLFFGHQEPGRFTEWHESLVVGIAAQASIAIDNARLFEQAQWIQKELQRSNQELRRANRDLETFAYSATHDLQEPLRTVAISAQLLEHSYAKQLEGDGLVYLSAVLQGAFRLENLIRDLLAYTSAARAAEGPLPSIDSSKVLANVILNLKTRIDQNGASITSVDLPVIPMHEVHLTQLFQNLISNAMKYRGEQSPHVHLSAMEQDGWWIFSVTDNGIGIDLKYADQIFGLFKRLHSREQYPGSGVGLAICQRIVEQYGGRIWLEKSAPGEGSVFAFAVPSTPIQ